MTIEKAEPGGKLENGDSTGGRLGGVDCPRSPGIGGCGAGVCVANRKKRPRFPTARTSPGPSVIVSEPKWN